MNSFFQKIPLFYTFDGNKVASNFLAETFAIFPTNWSILRCNMKFVMRADKKERVTSRKKGKKDLLTWYMYF